MEYHSAIKRKESLPLWRHGRNLKALCCIKSVRQRKTNTIWFHLYINQTQRESIGGCQGLVAGSYGRCWSMVVCVLVTQSCLTLCNATDFSLPGSSCHGIVQARILEWVGSPFSRGSCRPRDRIWVSSTAGRFFHLSHQGSPLVTGHKLSTMRWNSE